MKKFELTTNTKIHFGKKLFQIKALINFGNVKAGELGGYVEKEENISHEGNAWVCGDAKVYDNAEVCGSAWVCGDYDYTLIKGFGTRYRNTTFFRCEDGNVRVTCGCFYGTIEEFREQVKRTRSGKVAEEYLLVADLMEYHFKEDKE